MTRIVLIRHADPLMIQEMPAFQRPLTEKGRSDARVLGASLAGRSGNPIVWASPERRACETAVLAFPLVEVDVRDQLSEVKKPLYASADEHSNAVAHYLRGEVNEDWERREDVVIRMARLKSDFGSLESVVLVSHGVLLTTWLDHEIGLDDPVSFWSHLRMPDAWEVNLDKRSLERIV